MTNQEKTEQQAREYAETKTMPEQGYILTARNAFVACATSRQSEIARLTEENRKLREGYKKATEWISVEDELPKEGLLVETKRKRQSDSKEYIAINGIYKGDWMKECADTSRTTHWREPAIYPTIDELLK